MGYNAVISTTKTRIRVCKEDAKPTGHRTVFISDYHGTLCQAHAFNASDEGKALLKTRWQVEQTIAWLTRYQGCRQARCIGLAAAQCELSQACALRNLISWFHRQRRGAA